jgi:hypothetical protein
MKASSHRQLNVRSNEAYEIAHDLAEKQGKTTTDIVVSALRQFAGRRTIPSTKVTPEEADANYKAIMEGVRKANQEHPVDFSSQDIDELLYDEFGLPK